MFRILLIFAFFLASCSSWAQVETGTYAYGSFDTPGSDSIDRGSLNVHLSLPVVSKTGRGLPFQYSFIYDSLVWTPAIVSGVETWTPDISFGLHGQLLNEGYKGYLSYSMAMTTCHVYAGNPPQNITTYSNVTYHDAFGSQHTFPFMIVGCRGTFGPATDGSGFTIDGTFTVHALNGNSLAIPTYVNGAVSSLQSAITDNNGNQILTQGGTFTDTSGANVLSISGNGTPASPKVFSYLTYGINPNGTNPPSASVTITYKTYTVQTAFGCSGVGEYNQSQALVDKITLADSSFYQFTYESTPRKSPDVTGRLASITLPTGGNIAYSYTGGSNGINCADGTPTGITRTTSNGTRSYVRSAITAASSQTTITDGLNNASIFNFVTAGSPTAYYETNRAIYNGAAGGTPLLSRQTCYNGSAAPCSATAVTLPVSQIDTYESLNGGGEHGSTTKYNSYGLQTEQDTYDFGGASARGSLLRKEVWVYPSTGIVSLVSSDTVTDGNGNQLSQTTYNYDQTAVTATSGLPQHGGTVGTQRGNLTTASRWVNSPTSTVSTTYSYEDTGQPLTSTDPNGNRITYTYDSATHAFLSTATYPVPTSGATITFATQYDTSTGLLLKSTDPNSQATTYKGYDALLRLGEADYPDLGRTTYSYPSTTEVVTSQLQQGSTWITSVTDAFSLVYRVALDNEKLAVNPASRIRRKAEDNDRIRFLSSDEEQVLVAVLHDRWPHYLPVFHISLHTGMRTSEQIGLTWRDVTLEGKMLTLHKTKAKKTRHIPLNSVAMTAFRELEAAAKSAGHAVNHHSHVFLNTEGNPLRSTREWFEPAVRLVGLVDYTWHCNRHTFASRLVQAGVNMRRVAYLMGHSTIQMTMRYAHLAPDSNQEAVDRLVSPSLQVATKLAQEVSKSS